MMQAECWRIYNAALDAGTLVRPDACSKCGKVCVPDGHHADYAKPLDVEWLCRSCHKRNHPRGSGSDPQVREGVTTNVVGQAARVELRRLRVAGKLTQRAVASKAGVHHGIVGWMDGSDPGGVTVDKFVLYARGLGTQGWRVLRDVEESLFGEG